MRLSITLLEEHLDGNKKYLDIYKERNKKQKRLGIKKDDPKYVNYDGLIKSYIKEIKDMESTIPFLYEVLRQK